MSWPGTGMSVRALTTAASASRSSSPSYTTAPAASSTRKRSAPGRVFVAKTNDAPWLSVYAAANRRTDAAFSDPSPNPAMRATLWRNALGTPSAHTAHAASSPPIRNLIFISFFFLSVTGVYRISRS